MVIDRILEWWFGLVQGMVEAWPSTDNPHPQVDFGWIQDMNYFLPVSEMFGLFVIFFALGGPFVATSLIIWGLVGVLRGGATKA
jgi:hypothetical protein